MTVCINMNGINYLPSKYQLVDKMPPLVLADFMGVINIAHRFNHKPDVRTPLRVILHKNLRKVKRDECLRLTRLVENWLEDWR